MAAFDPGDRRASISSETYVVGGGHYVSVEQPSNKDGFRVKVEASSGWSFTGWSWSYQKPDPDQPGGWWGDIDNYVSEDNVNQTFTVTYPPSGDDYNKIGGIISITAHFVYTGGGIPPTLISVRTAKTGTGNGTTAGDGMYPINTSYTVTATADPGGNGIRKSKFIKWTNDVDSSSPTTSSVTRTATQDITWTAEFELVYNVKAAKQTVGGGAITVDAIYYCLVSGFGEYAYGEQVILSITPDSGASLIKIKDKDGIVYTPNNNTISFTMPSTDKEFYVLCAWRYADISVKIVTNQDDTDSSGGTFSPDPSGQRSSGYTTQMTATPNCGYIVGYSESSNQIWAFGNFVSDQSANPTTLTVVGGLTGAPAASFPEVDTSSLFESSNAYNFEVYFHSEPITGEILYSVYDGGTIIYGANGMPMAQY